MFTVIAVWTDTGRTDGRTDAKVVLYSVQCSTLHWTDNERMDHGAYHALVQEELCIFDPSKRTEIFNG